MKKEKPINAAGRLLAEKRWKNKTAEERSAYARRAAQAPRTAQRCFCGENSMWRAANRYFDCCRRKGVITLNFDKREKEREEEATRQD